MCKEIIDIVSLIGMCHGCRRQKRCQKCSIRGSNSGINGSSGSKLLRLCNRWIRNIYVNCLAFVVGNDVCGIFLHEVGIVKLQGSC